VLRVKEAFLKNFPSQHGAWSVLVWGWAIGTFSSMNYHFKSFLWLFIIIVGFCLRHSLVSAVKSWKLRGTFPHPYEFIVMFLYGILISVGFIVLVLFYHLKYLVLFAILFIMLSGINLIIELEGKHLTTAGEIAGMVSLSTVVPASYYVASEYLNYRAGVIWVLSLYLFAGSVFHVRYMVRERRAHTLSISNRLIAGKSSIIFHLFGFMIFLFAAIYHIMPPLNILAVSIVFFRALWMIIKKWKEPLEVRKIGFIELFITSVFSIIVIAVNR